MNNRKNKSGATVGIDLGTRNALCACVDRDGRPVMIPNRWGHVSTPSVVGWNGNWIVGEDAVRFSLRNSHSAWWDLKRKVGQDFRAFCGGKSRTAEEMLVPLLCSLREDAEVFLGQFVSSCVLAVPACFSLLQREALARAAKTAGMGEVRIVNEPTAAALAFGLEGRFLVLDFGAGTVDVSVAESENGVWQILESVGSSQIGGYDFDLALAEWLRERLRLGSPEADPSNPETVCLEDACWRTLIMEAETIKIALSSCRSYRWTPPPLNGKRFSSLQIYREDLERMIRFSIKRLLHVVQRLWERHSPERLLLVGGSSRIPLLRDIFEEEITRPERLSLCAEESVAAGAALYAQAGKERLLLDVLSGDIGFLRDGKPEILIYAGSPLPCTAKASFIPHQSEWTELSVFQSIGGIRKERTILSSLKLNVTAGTRLELRCSLSMSGFLHCHVKHGTSEFDMPLFQEHKSGGASAASLPSQEIRKLKLRLAPLEILLSPSQQDKLHLMVRQIESLEDDESSLEILEGIVKDLELALS